MVWGVENWSHLSLMEMEAGVKRGRGRPPKAKKPKGRERKPCKFFTIILPFTHLQQHSLRIPEKFAKGLDSRFPGTAVLSVPTGHSWKVTISRNENKLYFTKGWEDFMEHNSIRYGYFLEFEYKGNRDFRVHIYDLSCCEIDYPFYACPCSSKKGEPVQVKEEEEAFECPSKFETKCENDYSFTIVVQKSNFTKNSLYVPSRFAKKNILRKLIKSVKVEADDGREWFIRCRFYKNNKEARLNGCGWKNFLLDNNLDIRDIVTFVLVGKKRNHIRLKFFRKMELA